ncbi:helix-turn-helix domain-containing protein [Halorussus salilacus]|uniref:TrmB family transcriptional regulator n=1 Tax=Halorussus salilacus TaxID=2953750 RepID=UPI00209FB3E0|nr:helix-turn-helix domain-containing protein [Halorussus salilacus]USZ68362.1 helix-turn-helix domain-containing protein [Halorussus salilacus]
MDEDDTVERSSTSNRTQSDDTAERSPTNDRTQSDDTAERSPTSNRTQSDDAIEALEDMGLSNYEAKVFAALQRLGTGTARDVHRATDVPRSQVYGAAESLQERGLVEVQQSKPIQYRPVSLDSARSHLRGEFERTQEKAFDYLEAARKQRGDADERREDIWTVHGRTSIDGRVEQLLAEAERRVVFALGEDADPLAESVADALRECAESGVEVLVVNADAELRERFADDPVAFRDLPVDHPHADDPVGRVVVVDGETILLSVRTAGDDPELGDETAIWSSRTGIATVLIQLIDGGLGEAVSV